MGVVYVSWRNGIVDRNHLEKQGYNLIHRCTLVEMCPVNMVTKPVYKSPIEIAQLTYYIMFPNLCDFALKKSLTQLDKLE